MDVVSTLGHWSKGRWFETRLGKWPYFEPPSMLRCLWARRKAITKTQTPLIATCVSFFCSRSLNVLIKRAAVRRLEKSWDALYQSLDTWSLIDLIVFVYNSSIAHFTLGLSRSVVPFSRFLSFLGDFWYHISVWSKTNSSFYSDLHWRWIQKKIHSNHVTVTRVCPCSYWTPSPLKSPKGWTLSPQVAKILISKPF
jgi:hypothetical protein